MSQENSNQYTVPKFAERMGVSKQSIYQRVKSGHLQSKKINGKIFVIDQEQETKNNQKQPIETNDIQENLTGVNQAQTTEIVYLKRENKRLRKSLREMKSRIKEIKAEKNYFRDREQQNNSTLNDLFSKLAKALPNPESDIIDADISKSKKRKKRKGKK